MCDVIVMWAHSSQVKSSLMIIYIHALYNIYRRYVFSVVFGKRLGAALLFLSVLC